MNVAKKYRHTYSLDDMYRNVSYAIKSAFSAVLSHPRRKPSLSRWEGMYMAKAGKWYYAYTISGDTITIEDACHQQNMHEEGITPDEEEDQEL